MRTTTGGANDNAKVNLEPRTGAQIQVYQIVVVAEVAMEMMLKPPQTVAGSSGGDEQEEQKHWSVRDARGEIPLTGNPGNLHCFGSVVPRAGIKRPSTSASRQPTTNNVVESTVGCAEGKRGSCVRSKRPTSHPPSLSHPLRPVIS